MSPASQKLPDYLKRYVRDQDYDAYTAEEHACWRYIMRQNKAFFGKNAAPVYLEGLKKTGISTERIPRISEMNDCLKAFGWGAVAVEGFIPPAAFLDFQSRGVLPIACDMRTLSHLAYTPAPDIVHEAAGHAPILADPDYADYLHQYAAMAKKAIFSQGDVQLYEVIRVLSDVKENPDKSPQDIQDAETKLKAVSESITHLSEAMRVARMNWWTVEYGLVGDLKAPKIYGAGLLSSIGESQTCLSDKVRKIPLSIACVDTAYDITEPQPQLFVARDMRHLGEVLLEFEATLAYKRGGSYAIQEGIRAGTVTTTELDSGLQISGKLESSFDFKDSPCFVKYAGPVQLAVSDKELSGQGPSRHQHGFSSPLSRWKQVPEKPACELSDSDLKKLGLEAGKRGQIDFVSGFTLKGKLLTTTRSQGKLVLLTFTDCSITKGAETFYKPEWGEMDLAIGEKVVSVCAGAADPVAYGYLDVGEASTTPGRTSPFSTREKSLFAIYSKIRKDREEKRSADETAKEVLTHFSTEWLPLLELLELPQAQLSPPVAEKVRNALNGIKQSSTPPVRDLIEKGLQLI